MRSIEDIKNNINVFNFSEMLGCYMGLVKLNDCGTCSLVIGTNEAGFEHVSVAPRHKFRIPTWEDMAQLKSIIFEDEEEAYQIMPKASEYVNIKDNCLHIWRPANGKTLNDIVNLGGNK